MANVNNAKTRLLFHFDGQDGDTALIDSAVGGTTEKTYQNHAALSSADSKFGPTSLRILGHGKHLVVNPHIDWAFGASSFVIDCWIKAIQRPLPFIFYLDENNYFGCAYNVYYGSGAGLSLVWKVAGVVIADEQFGAAMNDWSHVLVERRGTEISVWSDGSYGNGHRNLSATYPINLQQWPLYIGAGLKAGVPGLQTMDGYVDEFRIHNDILLRSDDVTAGIEYDLQTSQYTRPYSTKQRGEFRLRQTCRIRAQGKHDMGILTYRTRARGQHQVRAEVRTRAKGVHPVRDVFTTRAKGLHSIGLTTPAQLTEYKHRAVGRTVIRATSGTEARGKFGHLNGTYRNRAYGDWVLFRSARNRARGQHSIFIKLGTRAVGIHDINTMATTYALYHAIDAMPDFTAAPAATSATLPFTFSMTGEGVHNVVTRIVSADGVESQNITATRIRLNASDQVVSLAPTVPREVSIAAAASGAYTLAAYYPYFRDVDPADKWVLFVRTDGTDPDPDLDTPVEVAIEAGHDGFAKLNYLSGSGPGGQTVKAIVGVRVTGGDDTVSGIVSAVTSVTGPSAPTVAVMKTVKGRGVQVVV